MIIKTLTSQGTTQSGHVLHKQNRDREIAQTS